MPGLIPNSPDDAASLSVSETVAQTGQKGDLDLKIAGNLANVGLYHIPLSGTHRAA